MFITSWTCRGKLARDAFKRAIVHETLSTRLPFTLSPPVSPRWISSNFLPFFCVLFHHFPSLSFLSSYQIKRGKKIFDFSSNTRFDYARKYLRRWKKARLGKLDRVSGAVSYSRILSSPRPFFLLVPFRDTSLSLSSLFPLPSSAKFLFFFLLFEERLRGGALRQTWPDGARIINSAE